MRLYQLETFPMIILDIHLGRFSLLIQRDSDPRTFRVSHEPGEVIIDLPLLRVFLSNYRRCAQS